MVGPIYGIKTRKGAIPVKNICIHQGSSNPDVNMLFTVDVPDATGLGAAAGPPGIPGIPGIFVAKSDKTCAIAIET